jgi:ferredoxin
MVSKAKTHMWTLMSGAAKNCFGLIPGLEKPVFHARFPEPDGFAQMIIDLNELVKPRLQVMDAVVGMEGDGPLSGSPRRLGAVLASGSCTALDVVLSRMMGIEPADVATIRLAAKRGLIAPDFSDIVTVGDPAGAFVVPDYRKPITFTGSKKGVRRSASHRLVTLLGRVYAFHPAIVTEKCVRCGKCQRICPMGAIRLGDHSAAIDLKKCIRCYCCHEMCSDGAIELRRGIGGKILKAIVG